MTIGDFASLMVALATTGSLIYISRQVNVTRRQARGQFLLALDDQFKQFSSVTVRLVDNNNPFKPQADDWGGVWSYMSVFERINIMLEDKILDIALVDRLYGFRLIALIANDAVYQMLETSGAEWQDFIRLCKAIAAQRQRARLNNYDPAFIDRVEKLRTDSMTTTNPWRSLLYG